jgi:hypothetical protein
MPGKKRGTGDVYYLEQNLKTHRIKSLIAGVTECDGVDVR